MGDRPTNTHAPNHPPHSPTPHRGPTPPSAKPAKASAPSAAGDDPSAAIEPDTKDKMEKSLEATSRTFASVRTGRANAAMMDRVDVDYYGTPTPLKSLGNISAPDAATIVIAPFDTGAFPMIEKAIMSSDLGITPSNDGKVIRLSVPPLTADRRKELVKTVAKLGEEGKVAIRNVRKASMKVVDALAKDKAISEDRKKSLDKSVQALTDAYVKKVDALVKTKSDELAKV